LHDLAPSRLVGHVSGFTRKAGQSPSAVGAADGSPPPYQFSDFWQHQQPNSSLWSSENMMVLPQSE